MGPLGELEQCFVLTFERGASAMQRRFSFGYFKVRFFDPCDGFVKHRSVKVGEPQFRLR